MAKKSKEMGVRGQQPPARTKRQEMVGFTNEVNGYLVVPVFDYDGKTLAKVKEIGATLQREQQLGVALILRTRLKHYWLMFFDAVKKRQYWDMLFQNPCCSAHVYYTHKLGKAHFRLTEKKPGDRLHLAATLPSNGRFYHRVSRPHLHFICELLGLRPERLGFNSVTPYVNGGLEFFHQIPGRRVKLNG